MVDAIMRLILLLFALLSPLHYSAARSEASDIAAATRSVVRIAVFSSADGQRTLIGHGSGVAVAGDRVVTNAHVAEQARFDESVTFTVVPSEGGKTFSARLVAASPGKDLALLQLTEGGGLIPASFYVGPVGDGIDAIAIGYPANVDIALEQSEEDVLRPTAPVKTRGSISSGRSSKSVESLLHTAPIAPGNSGGPLVDACGRVIGINSFGAVADGGGAEFYFAISTREVASFLQEQDVRLASASGECRSVAELTRAEAEREAAARAKVEAEARIARELRQSREGKARSDAEHAVIAARENHMAFAALLLVLGAVGAGAAWQFHERGQRDRFKVAASVGAVLFAGATVIFAVRPSFDEVDARVRAAMTGETADAPPAAAKAKGGTRRCVIQPERSRVTVSDTADVSFDWTANGCVNGRTQYVENGGRWLRSFVPNNEAQVSLVSYAPGSREYRIERYLLGLDAMEKAREARRRYEVTSCSAAPEVLQKVDNMNKAVREVLPPTPNEILLFTCTAD
jgi:serine protease Do